MSKFLSERFLNLEAYVPGEQPQDRKYIKLNTNENPYPPCDGVQEVINNEELNKLRLYSDPECRQLRNAAAKKFGISEDNIIFTNGSDEILSFAFMAYCDRSTKAAFPNISYGFYKVFADLYGIDYEEIPLNDDFSINVSDYLGINKTIFIANPNAPTGLSIGISDIEKISESNKNNIVVIDEAYIDFGGKSCYNLIDKYNNLIVVQTYSKSRSMAGARLGFAISNKEIIKDLNTIRYSTNPYNINRLTQLFGICALSDTKYFNYVCKKIIDTREFLKEELKKRGFVLTDSITNFVFAKHLSINGEKLYLMLKDNGILVRHFSNPKISDYLRITVGTDEEIKELLLVLDKIIDMEVNKK